MFFGLTASHRYYTNSRNRCLASAANVFDDEAGVRIDGAFNARLLGGRGSSSVETSFTIQKHRYFLYLLEEGTVSRIGCMGTLGHLQDHAERTNQIDETGAVYGRYSSFTRCAVARRQPKKVTRRPL